MLIGMIGSPCSGKTTTAAKLFAELKDFGLPCEFVVEEARRYIAQQRIEKPDHSGVLTDQDQLQIMQRQFSNETLMKNAMGDGIVVADSSLLNAFLYMSESFFGDFVSHNPDFINRVANHYDLVFVCNPVDSPTIHDPNRIHNYQESLKIHDLLEDRLRPFLLSLKRINLSGDKQSRLNTALREVSNLYWGKL